MIVHFYPAASTPGCKTGQAYDFRDSLTEKFNRAGVDVIGIPDKLEKPPFRDNRD